MRRRFGPATLILGARSRAIVPRFLLAVLALTVVTVHPVTAQDTGATGPELAQRIPDLAIDQVRSGMTGYALTAGPGNAIERFDVVVLSLQRDTLSGLDLALIRVSGAFIDASGGVAAGMSGSPVYLSSAGRTALLGAIAYVFPNADHHLALVTPIAAMRALTEMEAVSRVASPSLGPPRRIAVDGIGEFVPVATPILMSGADARAAALIAELFRTAAVTPLPLQAGAATLSDASDYELSAGSAIAAQLLRGAVELSAVGTVTAVDQSGILAFGHPFLGLGRASLPLAPAFVTAIVSSSVVPFKLANVGAGELGAVTQDRPAGLFALVGQSATMLPVSVTINAPGFNETFHLEAANDERLFPTLVAIGVLRLADRALQRTGAGSAAIAWRIEMSGGTSVNVLEQLSDPFDVALQTALVAAAPFAILADNEFAAPNLVSAELIIDLRDEQDHASLEEVVVENAPLRPGGHALLHLRLQPHRRTASVRTLSVPLPDDLGDTLTIVVRGGDVPLVSDKLPDDPQEEDGGPRSFGELLDALREQYQASEIIVEAITPDGKLRRLARLPSNQVITGSHELELTLEALEPVSSESEVESDPAENQPPGEGQ